MPTRTDRVGEGAAGPHRRAGVVSGALAAGLALAAWSGCGPAEGPEDVYDRALAAVESGRFNAAGAALERLGRLRSPTPLDWGLRARVAIARGQVDEALGALEHMPEHHPLSSWAHLRAGQLELRRRRFRPAEAQFRLALDRDPGLVEARRERIYILGVQLRRGELAREFEALSRQGTLTAREVWVWGMVADLAWWTPGEHGPILREALGNDPDDRWSRLALAESERRVGHFDEAQKLLAAMPDDDPDARAARAGLALERGRVDEAASLLAEGPEGHAGLEALRGRLALARGDGASAVRHLRSALAAEPGRRQLLTDLGRACTLAGHAEEARPYLDAAARTDALNSLLLSAEAREGPTSPESWRRLGAACEAAGRIDQARAWFALVAVRDPLDREAQQALFRLNRAARSRDQAHGKTALEP